MDIITSDGNRSFDAGNSEQWKSVYSTIRIRLDDIKAQISFAIEFFEKGRCEWEKARETARQINLVRDGLSRFKPNQAVYDYNKPEIPIPWIDSISAIVTSCANLYLTSDGQDLFFELVKILTYASIKKVDVLVEGLQEE